MIIRNQISSDGTLRTWKMEGVRTTMTVKKIEISPVEKIKIIKREERVAAADSKIRRHHKADTEHQGGIPGYAVQQRQPKSKTQMLKAMEKANAKRNDNS